MADIIKHESTSIIRTMDDAEALDASPRRVLRGEIRGGEISALNIDPEWLDSYKNYLRDCNLTDAGDAKLCQKFGTSL